MAVFTGVGVALVTLFDDRGALDAPATAVLADQLVAAGVRAVIVAGTTGEAATLERQERTALLDAVRGRLDGAVPVIAGTGAASAHNAVVLTRDAVEHGADAVLTLTPPGATDVRPYYEAVAAAAGDVPLLAYHYPAASAPGIPVAVLPELPVTGVKDSTGDAARLLETLEVFSGDVYTGSSWVLAYAGPLGCTGAILALANAEPEQCIEAFGGDLDAQRALTLANLAQRAGRLKDVVAERYGTSAVRRID